MNARRQMIIAALAAVLVTVLFFMFALRPKLEQISDVRSDIDVAQQEERRLQAELARLEAARDERPRTVSRLAIANRFVPTDPDLPGFIRLLQRSANASGIALLTIAPSPPTELDGANNVQVIDVTLTIEGGFRRLEDFLIRLENLERLVKVRSMTVTPATDELTDLLTLSTSISLQMFVATPEGRIGGGS